MSWIHMIILSIIEGITEFLPVSSTGHMVIADAILNHNQVLSDRDNQFTTLFEVCVQLGAILAVVVLYWKKFFDFSRANFYLKLIIAVMPALVIGALFAKKIDQFLQSPLIVASALLVGGIILLFVDNLFKRPHIDHEKNLHYMKAFSIGIWQVIAMIPGTSRSAATIVGGMQQGLTRRFAAEFSFFLAVPTMFAATGYKLLEGIKKDRMHPASESIFTSHNITLLLVGNLIAFVVAMIAIRSFIHFLQKHSLRSFGVYRIIAATAIFILIWQGFIKPETPTVPNTTQVSATVK